MRVFGIVTLLTSRSSSIEMMKADPSLMRVPLTHKPSSFFLMKYRFLVNDLQGNSSSKRCGSVQVCEGGD